jgi:hypothetical protein
MSEGRSPAIDVGVTTWRTCCARERIERSIADEMATSLAISLNLMLAHHDGDRRSRSSGWVVVAFRGGRGGQHRRDRVGHRPLPQPE